MRRIRDVLRLCWGCGLSERAAATSCALARSTVAKYLARARVAGLPWPLPEDLDNAAMERRLFLDVPVPGPQEPFVPDWAKIHRELARTGVTLQLLWKEYKQAHPDGYEYGRFSELYRTWRGELDLPMRQTHKAGEKLFVD